MHGINHNDFVVQVCRVLTDPIRAQHTKCTGQTTCSFFGFGSSTTLEFDLVDTFTLGFTVSCSLWYWLLTSTTSQANAVDDVPLFGSVTQSSGFIGTGGSRGSMDGRQMS